MSDDEYLYVWKEPRSGWSATQDEEKAVRAIERHGFNVRRIPFDETEEVEVQPRLTPAEDEIERTTLAEIFGDEDWTDPRECDHPNCSGDQCSFRTWMEDTRSSEKECVHPHCGTTCAYEEDDSPDPTEPTSMECDCRK